MMYSNPYPFLPDQGEMGILTRNYNWQASPLGPPDQWPQSLKTTVSMLLEARFPMFLWWGPELIQFYNDAYRPSLGKEGGKHPRALGQPGIECWPETWSTIKPLIDQVLTTGQSTWSEDQLIPIYRNDQLEYSYWTFSHGPVRNDEGQIAGVLVVCQETTNQVILDQQRKEALRQAQEAHQLIISSDAQQRFLLRLTDRLRNLTLASDIQYQAAALLGSYLGADRVGFAEDQQDGKTIVVTQNYLNGVQSLEGSYSYDDYGPALLRAFRVGTTVVRPDIMGDPTLTEQEKQAHAVLALGATVNKPLLKNGKLVLVLFIHYKHAHEWTEQELNLFEEVADRTWLAIEKARAEEALRLSEDKYRRLSEELDQLVQMRTQELEQSVSELKYSNDKLQQFAYVASHDLQEPLRKIQVFSTLLANQAKDKAVDDLIERISLAGNRMSTLVNDLLTYASLKTSQQDFKWVSLQAVVKNVLMTLDWEIQQSQATIEVEDLPQIKGEATQLGQVFQNLLTNALKFVAAGESPFIRITHKKVAAQELPEKIRPTNRIPFYHQICIMDKGVGFDPTFQDRIFQVFQRLHDKKDYPGTGIGLAICYQVINAHGGSITASSELGKGSTFCIYLPA